MVRIYKQGNNWLMDTTTKVGGREVPITVYPDSRHLEMWFALHPEDDVTSSAYHEGHCIRCVFCHECMDCNIRECTTPDGLHSAFEAGHCAAALPLVS